MSLAGRMIESVIVRGTHEDAWTHVVDFTSAEDQDDFSTFLKQKNVDFWLDASGGKYQVYFQAPQSGSSGILNSLARFNGKLNYKQSKEDMGGRNSTTLPPTTRGGW